jgi:hypothetical protein
MKEKRLSKSSIDSYVHIAVYCRPRRSKTVGEPHDQNSTTSGVQVSHWTPPPSGFAKIMVDGAVIKNLNLRSFSAIWRDEHVLFLGASAMKVAGISDPSVLEALAC